MGVMDELLTFHQMRERTPFLDKLRHPKAPPEAFCWDPYGWREAPVIERDGEWWRIGKVTSQRTFEDLKGDPFWVVDAGPTGMTFEAGPYATKQEAALAHWRTVY